MKAFFTVSICLLSVIHCTAGIFTIDTNDENNHANLSLLQEPTKGTPLGYIPNEIIVKFREDIASTLEVKLAEGALGRELKLTDSLDKLNKKYKVSKTEPLLKNFKKSRLHTKALLKRDEAALTKKERHLLRRLKRAPKNATVPQLERIYKIQVELEPGQSLEQVVQEYQSNPDVEYAEVNYIVSICKTPNDLLYPIQWPLNNIGQMYPERGYYNHPPGTPDCDIDAPEAWDIHTGSSEVIVAVIDTGVDYKHRDLLANIWVNEAELNGTAGVDDDGNGYIDDIYGYDFYNNDANPLDDNGHGTHCSGIVAADGDNGLDIAGVCWNARIMAVKFLNYGGQGSNEDAIEAFYYAVENGADVTSNSWGGGDYSQAMEEAINYAHSQGVIMVAAAGNNGDTEFQYPAYYDNMISVAATNSNDERAPFSTYGDWVDIAAPGVDVLSLFPANRRAIGSGTSMACPHVSGACALMLSLYPPLEVNEVTNLLQQTTDHITPGVCASGRLNLYEAIRVAASFAAGVVYFDSDAYSCPDTVQVIVKDLSLMGKGIQDVNVTTSGGDSETVTLTETTPSSAKFIGKIPTVSGDPLVEDGKLQVFDGQVITVTYHDVNDGTGNPAIVTDTAIVDCQPPEIFNVHVEGIRSRVVIFNTNEPTTGRVRCGTTCGTYTITAEDKTLATVHGIRLTKLVPETRYYFVVEGVDPAGNETLDDNSGQCYSFTSSAFPAGLYVPSEYATIQEAIDAAVYGETVWVEDGIYTGDGNRDITFRGKTITVRSENGPERCIINCEGTEIEPHRGFYFHSGEDANSVLNGITITNGYIPGSWNVGIGGGILCINNSCPTITNCIVAGNLAGWDGGGICNLYSSPNIDNCTFTANSAIGNDGGAINNEESSPTITNCIFTANSAYDWGGAIRNIFYSSPTVTNCVFAGNSADDGGAMYYYFYNEATITNCTFAGNIAQYGNAIASNTINNIQITNSILVDGVNEIWSNDSSTITINYSDIQGGWPGQGNIDVDPCFVDPGYWANANDPNIIVEPNDPNAIWIDGDYHLLENSPCINAGDPNYVAEPNEKDLDGRPRILLGRVDMGAYEFNHIPVADPGPNQVAYAWIDGLAEVTLDGSASYDEDGQELTYKWAWSVDGNTFTSTGTDGIINMLDFAALAKQRPQSENLFADLPILAKAWLSTPASPNWNLQCDVAAAQSGAFLTIKLPVGEHIIELIVNDGIEDSEPDCVTVTVIGPMKSYLWLLPQVIHRNNPGPEKITALLSLPEGVTKNQIDTSQPLMLYPGGIEAVNQYIFDIGSPRHRNQHAVIIAFFDKADLLSAVPNNGRVKLKVVGRLKTGQYFFGSDFITISRWPWWPPCRK